LGGIAKQSSGQVEETMNRHIVYRYIARRLAPMSDAELEAVRQDCLHMCEQAMKESEQQAHPPSEEELLSEDDFKERLAERLRKNPHELPRLRSMLEESEQHSRKKRNKHEYFEEAWANREAAELRWEAIQAEITKVQFPECRSRDKLEKLIACADLPKLPGIRVAELIAYAELYAGAEHLGDAWKAVDAHLRKQKIDALASFMAWLSDPMAGTTEPLEAA
jgi:hypothetical protein